MSLAGDRQQSDHQARSRCTALGFAELRGFRRHRLRHRKDTESQRETKRSCGFQRLHQRRTNWATNYNCFPILVSLAIGGAEFGEAQIHSQSMVPRALLGRRRGSQRCAAGLQRQAPLDPGARVEPLLEHEESLLEVTVDFNPGEEDQPGRSTRAERRDRARQQ